MSARTSPELPSTSFVVRKDDSVLRNTSGCVNTNALFLLETAMGTKMNSQDGKDNEYVKAVYE